MISSKLTFNTGSIKSQKVDQDNPVNQQNENQNIDNPPLFHTNQQNENQKPNVVNNLLPTNNLNGLPNELKKSIFGYLDNIDIDSVSQTNKQNRTMANAFKNVFKIRNAINEKKWGAAINLVTETPDSAKLLSQDDKSILWNKAINSGSSKTLALIKANIQPEDKSILLRDLSKAIKEYCVDNDTLMEILDRINELKDLGVKQPVSDSNSESSGSSDSATQALKEAYDYDY